MNRPITVALVGNPNCGKSTLFNALTGAKQRIGNWPGVTVEKKHGWFTYQNTTIEIIDLPGLYHLEWNPCESAIDEQITQEVLFTTPIDLIINVVAAPNLERNLYLSTQLLTFDVPVIVVLNMMDVVKKQGDVINESYLSEQLGCPVVSVSSVKKEGIEQLKQKIGESLDFCRNKNRVENEILKNPEIFLSARTELKTALQSSNPALHHPTALAQQLLESSSIDTHPLLDDTLKNHANALRQTLKNTFSDDPDIVMADRRYTFIHCLVEKAYQKNLQNQRSLSERIDDIVLNRWLGIPIFLSIMYAMFFFAINVGGAFQDFFDISTNAIFVEGFSQWLNTLGSPVWLTALLASGVGKGLNTTLTFIPVIASMYFFLAFLEDCGYMSRAAFVMDRLMQFLGLPGKSFVPMIVGFGCNVPAVMAARTLENQRDRILTVLMSPFMSCGARLSIFAVFTAAFFPIGGQNIVFSLYLIGIGMAIFTAFLLRKTVLKGTAAPLILELPAYHLPTFRGLCQQMWRRLKSFLLRAGKLIIPICMLIGTLNAFNTNGTLNEGDASKQSILSAMGRTMTPVFAPMGITQDNWPATVGLLTGVLAKEVVIGTLNTLYTQSSLIPASNSFHLKDQLIEAARTVPENIKALSNSFGNPVLASAPAQNLSQNALGEMYQRFHSQAAAFAYLLFVLLYVPCISTIAIIAKELNRRWALFSVAWNTGLAYIVAVIAYQCSLLAFDFFHASEWIFAMMMIFLMTVYMIAKPERRK